VQRHQNPWPGGVKGDTFCPRRFRLELLGVSMHIIHNDASKFGGAKMNWINLKSMTLSKRKGKSILLVAQYSHQHYINLGEFSMCKQISLFFYINEGKRCTIICTIDVVVPTVEPCSHYSHSSAVTAVKSYLL